MDDPGVEAIKESFTKTGARMFVGTLEANERAALLGALLEAEGMEQRRVHAIELAHALYDTGEHCDDDDCPWGENHATVYVPKEPTDG